MGKRAQLILLLALPIAALRMTTIDVAAVRAAAAPFSCAILRRGDTTFSGSAWRRRSSRRGPLNVLRRQEGTGETSLQCVVRELNEELGWAPDDIPAEPACSLLVDGRLIAHFYEASVDRTDFVVEPGDLSWTKATQRWSAWHARVLAARGDAVAVFDDGGDPAATLALLRAVPTAGEEAAGTTVLLSGRPTRRCRPSPGAPTVRTAACRHGATRPYYAGMYIAKTNKCDLFLILRPPRRHVGRGAHVAPSTLTSSTSPDSAKSSFTSATAAVDSGETATNLPGRPCPRHELGADRGRLHRERREGHGGPPAAPRAPPSASRRSRAARRA